MDELAKEVKRTMKEEIGAENMVGVSYYDEDGVGHVFRSEWAEAKYDPEEVDKIVEDLRFESLGHPVRESYQQERLEATVRIYEEMWDTAIPTNEHTGIVVALDTEADYSIQEVVDRVKQTIERFETAKNE